MKREYGEQRRQRFLVLQLVACPVPRPIKAYSKIDQHGLLGRNVAVYIQQTKNMKPLLEGLNTGVFKKLVRRLRLESFLIAILFTGLLGGCSNSETTEKTAEPTPKTVDAILKLDNLWILTNYKSSVYIAELENVGDKPIKAFVAEWVILDDLDRIIASSTIEYTSDTQYSPSSKEQSTPGHLILKGEHICMQTMSIPSLSEQEAEMMKATGIGTSAYSKEQIRTRVLMGMGELPQEALDEKRVTKKIRFSLEKVVFAD